VVRLGTQLGPATVWPISAKEPTLLLVGPRAVDFLCLWRRVPTASAVVAEGGAGGRRFTAAGARLVALEDRLARRRLWSSESIDALIPAVTAELARLSSESDRVVVVPYATTENLERAVAAAPGARLVGPSAAHRWWLDSKPAVRAALAERGVPVVPWQTVDLSAASYHDLRRALGPELVVQADRGSTGVGTSFVRNEDDFRRIVQGGAGPRMVSAYAGDCVLNFHLAMAECGVAVLGPSVQLSGLPAIGVPAPIYCGNDFAATAGLPAALIEGSRSVAATVAEWLHHRGYRGLAGLDLVTDGTTSRVLEVNPRLQGSTWLVGEAQGRAGSPATLNQLVFGQPLTGATTPAAGAQLILRRPPAGEPAVRPAVRRVGVYAWRRGGLRFDRPALGLLDCDDHEIFIDGITHLPVDRIQPLAVVGRIASWQPLIQPDGRRLTEFGSAVLAQIHPIKAEAW
jgi:hypothetical protein